MITTQDQILAAAVTCFNETGFEQTTFKDIASKVGVTQPLIYKYFKNKMDLFAACGLMVAAEGRIYIDASIDQRASALERLLAYAGADLEWFANHKSKAQILLGINYFALSDKTIETINNEILRIGLERIETHLVQIGHETGTKFQNVSDLSRIIHSIMVGEIIKLHHSKAKQKTNLARTLLFSAIKKILKN